MKNFKKLSFLFIAFLLMVSCEQESTETEALDFESEQQINHPPKLESLEFYQIERAGLMLREELSKENSPVDFFDEENLFLENICNDLSEFEDFNDFNSEHNSMVMYGDLNEFTNNGNYSPGDIVPGVSFSSYYSYEVSGGREGVFAAKET